MRPEQYAVVFREPGGPPTAGSLQLGQDGLRLSGGSGGRSVEVDIDFSEVVDIHVGRTAHERLNGSPTLVIVRDQLPEVLVAPLGAGLLHEVADLLATLAARGAASSELAIVVPLRPGCSERARELLELGPPLDPAGLGLTSHQVYLEDDRAVFVFRGPEVRARVRRAMRTPALWRAGLAWRACIDGQPQIADADQVSTAGTPAYTWNA